ncbi:MAG: Txe/YoeB family addiction module toxin [Clostridia bacterium]|nr:Txe/YoeB family addiction module toxin [Clostridia bacterium]
MKYKIVFTKQAEKDLHKLAASPLKDKAFRLLAVLEENPMQPPFEKLINLGETFSRRINLQHRLVYQIIEEEKTVKILRAWTHYGDN